jgi:hypothetical protein
MWPNVERMAIAILAEAEANHQAVEAEQLTAAFVRATGDLMRHCGESEVDDAELRERILPQVRRAMIRWSLPSTI